MKKSTSVRMARPGNDARFNGNELDAKQLLAALMAFKRGDFTVRLPDDWIGVGGKIADAFNDVIGTNQRMTEELERIGRVVGKEGRTPQGASLGDVWHYSAHAIRSVNPLLQDLLNPSRTLPRLLRALATPDLPT